MRVGIGFDVHAFGDDRPLRLGGVELAHDRGLSGHSDGDVLAHAVCDAVLGGAALGDMGMHFPSSDERWRDADSLIFIRDAVQRLAPLGLRVSSVDTTVVCEAPRIGPHREAMQHALADALGISAEDVSIKASTTDGLGFTGRGEGIAAHAVVVLTDAH